MSKEQVDQIYRFMTAYPFEEIKEAFIILNRDKLQVKQEYVKTALETFAQEGWEQFEGGREEIPEGCEWSALGSKIFIRTPERFKEILEQKRVAYMKEVESQPPPDPSKPKTDLSMKPTDKVCITCGGVLAWEPICPGCKLGKSGFVGRYVCMEDMDHEFYVLREGLVLPNQGD